MMLANSLANIECDRIRRYRHLYGRFHSHMSRQVLLAKLFHHFAALTWFFFLAKMCHNLLIDPKVFSVPHVLAMS